VLGHAVADLAQIAPDVGEGRAVSQQLGGQRVTNAERPA
jgi:hypothetical protein